MDDSLRIIGITESKDGTTNDIEVYHRKVSTGFAPNEKPWNDKSYPKASGFFRVMEQKYIKIIGNGGVHQVIQKWVLDKKLQKNLELRNSEKKDNKGNRIPNNTPRRLPIMCLHSNISQFAEAKMCKWNGLNQLDCTSSGDGTPYSMIKYDDDGDASHVSSGQKDGDGKDMEFCDIEKCAHRQKAGGKSVQCKPSIKLTIFPKLQDVEPNILEPWRIDSSAINTVTRIASSLRRINKLMELSYEAEKGSKLTEDERAKKEWFFGKNLCLTHIQIVSGGKKVWITDIIPSNTLKNELMGPILKAVYLSDMVAKQRLIETKKSMNVQHNVGLDYKNSNNNELLKDAESMLKTESQADDDNFIDAEIVEIETLEEESHSHCLVRPDCGEDDPSQDSKSTKKAKDKLKNES